MDYPTQERYDKNRKKDTPSSQHIIKICGYGNWNEMINDCDLNKKKVLNVIISHNENVSENELKNIIQVLSQTNLKINQK